jgi:dihydroorotase
MIIKNAKIYADGLTHKGAMLIKKGYIIDIIFNPSEEDYSNLLVKNDDEIELDCQNKLVLPGIIDVHSHLRDMEQQEKETFLTGTKAAAFSGITTLFTMPNTKPPAINAKNVKKWISKAKNNIYVDVGFIAGVPKNINEKEIKKIIDLGVVGFKIYPLNSLSGISWLKEVNIQKILRISSKYQIPIFIHSDKPLEIKKKNKILEENYSRQKSLLEIHNELHPDSMELSYVQFIIGNYDRIITNNKLSYEDYPIIHFCHISTKQSYDFIVKTVKSNTNYKISYEVTPHHLLLSKNVKLKNENVGKVLPPLRDLYHSTYLFEQLINGNIQMIATDHAPHTLQDKSGTYLSVSSGFPGFETYPLLLLNKVVQYKLPLEVFVKAASENPANYFHLHDIGFIKKGYEANLIIIEKTSEYAINPKMFKTKAKFSPFENFKTQIKIWKVFLRGEEINYDDCKPMGKIIIK